MKKYLLICVLAFATACVQAAVGLAQLPPVQGDGPITVYYPAAGPDGSVQRGPFTLEAALDAQPVRGNARLVVAAGVPYAVDFDAASLAASRVPLGLVTAGQDKWLPPRFHSDAILAACRTCELIAHMPAAGHGALLSPPPPLDLLGGIAADLLADPPGFDRGALPEIDRRIADFMRRHLLP